MRSAIALVLVLGWTGLADAQPSPEHGELFVNIAFAQVFRAEDRNFGNRPDIGGGVRLPITRRIGVSFDLNRALGLRADPARCGLALGCQGAAREGLRDAMRATANGYCRLPHHRSETDCIGGWCWLRAVG